MIWGRKLANSCRVFAKSDVLREVVRYGLAGVVNSLVGYGVFIMSLYCAHTSPLIANAAGYAVGLCVAFVLNRYFVFAGVKFSLAAGARFLLCFAVAFVVNQLVLIGMVRGEGVDPRIAQLFSMAMYTVIFYILNKRVVWAVTDGH